MSFYTTKLRDLLNTGFDIGLKTYPIFDEAYRQTLNQKIIDHFYMREIGAETPALFKFFLNRKLNEVMPYYNQLYKSAQIEYDPLVNNITQIRHVKNNNEDWKDNHTGTANTADNGTYDRTRSETTDTSDHTESNTFSERRGVNSDTPQQQIGLKGIVFDALYATSADTSQEEGASVTDEIIHSDQNETIGDRSSSTQDYNDEWENTRHGDYYEDYFQTHEGLVGQSQPDLIKQFRETFLNIDMMVIEELNCCFLMLYQ